MQNNLRDSTLLGRYEEFGQIALDKRTLPIQGRPLNVCNDIQYPSIAFPSKLEPSEETLVELKLPLCVVALIHRWVITCPVQILS
jgi:hypothetical protein